jgi:AmiR/NasT family two-component response regulator
VVRTPEEAAAAIVALEEALASALAHVEQLEAALESRDLIGQAKGLLMERGQVNADEAFDQLTRLSQLLNIKVRDLALKMLELPEPSSPPRGSSST